MFSNEIEKLRSLEVVNSTFSLFVFQFIIYVATEAILKATSGIQILKFYKTWKSNCTLVKCSNNESNYIQSFHKKNVLQEE